MMYSALKTLALYSVHSDRFAMPIDSSVTRVQYYTKDQFADFVADIAEVDYVTNILGDECSGIEITYTKWNVLSVKLFY